MFFLHAVSIAFPPGSEPECSHRTAMLLQSLYKLPKLLCCSHQNYREANELPDGIFEFRNARVIENTVKSYADFMLPFRDNPISINLKDYHF